MKLRAMFDELVKLCGMHPVFVQGQVKLSRLTDEQALSSLERLEQLRDLRGGELARGAALGAAAGPFIGATGRLVSGAARPSNALRQAAAEATTGALFSGALPYMKNRMETTVEKQKLKDYLDKSPNRTVRSKIRRSLGV